jgi:hypothetical protein
MDEHAGLDETSRLMFLRPDLVSSSYAGLALRTANQRSRMSSRRSLIAQGYHSPYVVRHRSWRRRNQSGGGP